MTEVADVAIVLKRTDARLAARAGDDPLPPETIDALAHAVRTQIVDPLLADSAPATRDTAEADELERARQTIERLRAELDGVRQQIGPGSELRRLQRQLAEANANTDSARSQRDKMQARLHDVEIELAAARRALDRRAGAHRHLYPLEGDKPGVCACGKPWPGGKW